MQIIAMGGGGFSMEPDNPLLDRYILAQAGKAVPKICFIPTASGDSEDYIARFYRFFEKESCVPSHLSLLRLEIADLRSFLLDQDILYVGGGNSRNLLALWREWGLDAILREAWEKGILLAGISAGSICWFEEGLTDSVPGRLTPIQALGFLPGSNTPHYDGEADRRPAYLQCIQRGQLQDGLAMDDGAAVHFVGTAVQRAICSRPEAAAYRVSLQDGKAVEAKLPMHNLGE
ncbi:peptidase E [Ectobacillus ponti]|uniref:Peptidase E n=1 Tax=Ectobacillus ponti TaxID=2961894 RepID=A0AA41XB02_9BACI|nr:peptidase E [Ectobacillus ponti]MCP8969630.1 peptidase E [Ectobacillus ponti]